MKKYNVEDLRTLCSTLLENIDAIINESTLEPILDQLCGGKDTMVGIFKEKYIHEPLLYTHDTLLQQKEKLTTMLNSFKYMCDEDLNG